MSNLAFFDEVKIVFNFLFISNKVSKSFGGTLDPWQIVLRSYENTIPSLLKLRYLMLPKMILVFALLVEVGASFVLKVF